MELRHLRTFIAVVECGGFRRAATKLHFSQPAVTAQIRDLERSLGVSLFERLPGHVCLTPDGIGFVESAQRLVEQADAAVAAVRRDQLRGELRLGIYPGSGAELTRPLLVELRRSWPAVDLDVVPLPLTSWATAVEGIDALIMRDPIDPTRVRATELFSEPLMAAVPWSWPARETPALTLDEFLELPFVKTAPTVPAALRDFWCLQDHRNGDDPEFRGYGASSAEDVADDVSGGFGASVGTRSIQRTFPAPRVSFVHLSPELRTHAWLTTRLEDPRCLIDALHDSVASIVRRVGPLVLPELSAGLPWPSGQITL